MSTETSSSHYDIPHRRRIANVVPSKDAHNDWGAEHAIAAGILQHEPSIPSHVDLREPWWKVGDQRETGACVGWATADSVLRWHFVKAGRLHKDTLLSPRFIWMAAKETDDDAVRPTTFIDSDGTSLKTALTVAQKYGAVPDDMLPFDHGGLYPGDEKTFYATASRRRIANYINLGRDPQKWREWIATNGPILTRLDIDVTWDGAKETDGYLANYEAGKTRGGHAVAMVGYTADYFIVRNSWGTSVWGDKGFAYASLAYAQQAFTEAYGVTV